MTLQPVVTSSGGTIDAARLVDGDYANAVSLPVTSDGTPAWIQFEFASPHAIRGASIAHAGLKWPFGPPPPGTDLEASDDGRTFRKVATVPRSTAEQNTVSFEPVVARVFRLSFPASAPDRLPRERCAPAAASGQEP